MVDKKDKKKKAKKTVTQKQKQKQKQSVVVNVNMSKPATRRRTLAKKTHDNRPLPPTPQAYGIPVQQSVQPSLNNIVEYLKQKEGQENNRHVNILSAMRAIQRDEGQQGGRVQSERASGTSTQAPAVAVKAEKPAVAVKAEKAKVASKGGGGGGPVEEALRYIDSLPEAMIVQSKGGRRKKIEIQEARAMGLEDKPTRSFKAVFEPTAASEPEVGKTFN